MESLAAPRTAIEPFFFDTETLQELAARHAGAYRTASPFPHVVIDDFLPEDVAQRVLDEFPSPDDLDWYQYGNARERKLMASHETLMGPLTRQVLGQLNAVTVIGFLERLTGVDGLVPDPHLLGGGMHQIQRGGFLKVHADFNRHHKLNLDRRLNLLLYLNRDWHEEYGGHLELWDPEMQRCVQRIAPVFNRCVVFSTTSWSYHGHPHPLTCPEDRTRRSLALYYYSNGRPDSEVQAPNHSTLFKRVPGENATRRVALRDTARHVARQLLPPLAVTGLARARNAVRGRGRPAA
ncbi:MAG TPA: 2OG-Fe(II) oxygenase [Candidatus Angelobacter sp.]|jgi:Rps23 Pro-64 3,4-dihydroxylase Tpa1-like proline 4-hydroxylase|nr:2OG-Fe(II) oxygenase [Candidatus Angelobacter sp.]